MSCSSLPITPTAFSEAIKELPLSAVYSKAAELRNSIAHLQRSNTELRAFLVESCDSDEEKKELEGYISENEAVMASMNERIALLRTEIENRGQIWIEIEEEEERKDGGDEDQQQQGAPVTNGENTASDQENGVYL